ncbi:OLC1v1002005C1 [Oldenlandia corymbosa var. corymbosa]|uniref:Cysteine proteinase inhibitor n=1 Tax=Oldenlandia corymbosa var. corymbosa TaxID=529605 RepID=A0AAV1D944_OLDCO|nr:OLC1v1002005C1 [Oldenlandia corymbosa var. corymbosa]
MKTRFCDSATRFFFFSFFFILASSLAFAFNLHPHQNFGFCGENHKEDAVTSEQSQSSIQMAAVGAPHDSSPNSSNSAEIEEIARFAVEQHNHKENAVVELGRVVKAEEQVVSGKLHHLTLEIIEAGKKKLYEAKVWVKPWLNFKELQEFKYIKDVIPSFTSSDLGVKKPDRAGWRSVPVHDPNVKDAAEHALKTIQQRSNSLIPYELHEIVHAQAELTEESAKFDMLLKLKRGEKEEKLKVEVHKNNNDGAFRLNKMEPDRS